jgi:hypothetical protein
MGWTVATYIVQAVLILVLPIMLVIVYHLIKQELVEIKNIFGDDKKCLFCERVSLEVWACYDDQDYCINCCYCQDHKETIHKHGQCKTAPDMTWCGLCAEIN